MIIMTLRLTVPPEKTADAIAIIGSMVGPVSVESACKQFCMYRDISNDNTLLLMEEWESQAALEDHIRSDDFWNILSMMELAREPPEIKFVTASNTAGMELIEELRG